MSVQRLGRPARAARAACLVTAAVLTLSLPAHAQEPLLGEIRMFAGNFAPRGWALCDGQILPISQNTALFSLLGTTYGGDGRTTFALPDLRGRAPIHAGRGPGLQDRRLGESSGEEQHALQISEIPSHRHTVSADSGIAGFSGPVGMFPARDAAGIPQYGDQANSTMNPSLVGTVGGGQAHNNMQPYLVVNYIIALQGIYPSR